MPTLHHSPIFVFLSQKSDWGTTRSSISSYQQPVYHSGLRTPKNSIISPNLKKYFFCTPTWTWIKLFDFTRKIFKLLKWNKRSLRNIVCFSIVTTTQSILMVLNSWSIVLNLLHERNIFIFLIAWAPAVKKVVSILDIHLPELEKAYFCRTRTWTRK